MEKISRNDYFALIRKLVSEGRPLPNDNEYDIIPISFDGYKLNEKTKRIVNANFMHETTDPHHEYMLTGHWLENLSYQFAAACDFTLETLNGLSEYAFSDEQLSLFTYCEGDITFSPYKDEELYKKRKMEMINFYNEEEGNAAV